jgi:hypothetical protein
MYAPRFDCLPVVVFTDISNASLHLSQTISGLFIIKMDAPEDRDVKLMKVSVSFLDSYFEALPTAVYLDPSNEAIRPDCDRKEIERLVELVRIDHFSPIAPSISQIVGLIRKLVRTLSRITAAPRPTPASVFSPIVVSPHRISSVGYRRPGAFPTRLLPPMRSGFQDSVYSH